MGVNWQQVNLRDVVNINPPRQLQRGCESVYVAMEHIHPNSRSITSYSYRKFTGSGSRFRKYDTLLARITPCLENGKTAFVDFIEDNEFGHGSTEFIVLSGKEGISDNSYVYYLARLPAFREFAISLMEGTSGRQRVPANALRRFEFYLPPLPEQKAIAHILGTLDDKIELNQQMNRNLEAIAQAIFKSWFVDFAPVRAKIEGRQQAGMDSANADLFPDSFEDSPLGEIPKGWKIKPLDRIANFLNGLALQKHPPIADDYLPVIKIAELRRGVTESSGRASSNIKTEYVVEDGDILFSWSGSLEVCIWCGGRGALNQHLFKVTSADYPKWFYYQWVKYYLPNFQAIAASKATTMGHIQRHHLAEAQVLVPPAGTLQMMDKRMTPLLNLIVSNSLESRALRAIRDTLLPKLMSGEIRVKEAEKTVEAVA